MCIILNTVNNLQNTPIKNFNLIKNKVCVRNFSIGSIILQ